MEINLAKVFIQKQVIKNDVMVTAIVRTPGLADEHVYVSKELVLTEASARVFEGFNKREPKIIYRFKAEDITDIEGMTLERIARAYLLNEDGTPRKTGKKPGRKPKEKVQ